MDRLMVYPGAIPLDTDILSVERNVMKALGWLMQATLGTGTGVVGLACTPTVPASMVVNIGSGALWSQEVIDQSNFGSLTADTSPLMKMGILAEAGGTNFTLTAPSTSGQSINYLIEAAFIETDETPIVLPYVNPANPAQPFTGPNNTGTAQNTIRAQSIALQLKAGVAANTGAQVTPNVDAGYVGLYLITVNFGQTSIVGADISQLAGAPFNTPPFAALAGNENQPFSVAPATLPTQASQLQQVQNAIEPYNFLLNGLTQDTAVLADCNAALAGYSSWDSTTKNAPIPDSYGVIYQFANGVTGDPLGVWVTQYGYAFESAIPFVRNNINDGGWSAWVQLGTMQGSSGQTFEVANATLPNQAVALGQFENISTVGQTNGLAGTGTNSLSFTAPCAGVVYLTGAYSCTYYPYQSVTAILSINGVNTNEAVNASGTVTISAAGYVSQGQAVVLEYAVSGSLNGFNILSYVFVPNTAGAL